MDYANIIFLGLLLLILVIIVVRNIRVVQQARAFGAFCESGPE